MTSDFHQSSSTFTVSGSVTQHYIPTSFLKATFTLFSSSYTYSKAVLCQVTGVSHPPPLDGEGKTAGSGEGMCVTDSSRTTLVKKVVRVRPGLQSEKKFENHCYKGFKILQ